MRELIIYTGCFSEPEENAAGKRVLGISLALEDAGYDVIMLGKAQRNHTKRIKYTDHIFFEALPEYGRVQYNGYYKHIVSFIEKQEKNLKCIIRYSSPGLSVFDYKLNRYCRNKGIPIVADVVDWLAGSGPSLLYIIVKNIDTYLEKALFNKMGSGVIAISSYLGEYYKKSNKNVIVIPPLVSRYTKNINLNNKRIIVYAGIPFRRGLKVKNERVVKDRLDLAVKACIEIYNEGIKDFIFDIYGVTKKEFIVAYPNFKDNLTSFDSIICFHGKEKMEVVQRKINQADFTILLRENNRSTMAGFSTKVVESLSCGTPVIVTKTSDLSSYINDNYNGFFVDIDNWRELKEKLKEIINLSNNKIIEMKNNCYEQKTFQFNNYSASLSSFIDNLITKK